MHEFFENKRMRKKRYFSIISINLTCFWFNNKVWTFQGQKQHIRESITPVKVCPTPTEASSGGHTFFHGAERLSDEGRNLSYTLTC